MNLTAMRVALKLDLGDATWDTDELDRGVVKAVADLSRYFPAESIHESTISLDISSESWTSSDAHGTYKSLTYKPIKYQSETVKSDDEVTTYTRDTDYTMDYSNGEITTINGGDMAVSTNYKINYTKSKYCMDITSLLTSLISIRRVEYPVGATGPQEHIPFNLWGSSLYIGSYTPEGSTELSNKKHIAIYYDSEHTAPTSDVDGTYEQYLDEVALKGAAAYAIMSRGIALEHAAKTNHESAITALATISNSDVETALGNVGTYVGYAHTALGNITAEVTSLQTALTAVGTYITDANTALDAMITSNEAATTAIANVAALITAIGTAIDNIDAIVTDGDSALGKVTTQIASMATALGEIAAIWTDEQTYRGYAHSYLTSGDDYINKVNVGAQVASRYSDYGQVERGLAQLSESVRNVKLGEASSYLNSANSFVAEANSRVSLAGTWLAKAREITAQVNGRMAETNGQVAIANNYNVEATSRLGMSDRYLGEAQARVNTIANYIAEANANIAGANAYIAEAGQRATAQNLILQQANGYIATAAQQSELSRKYMDEAIERRNEFWSILRDRSQHRNDVSLIPQRQLA